MIISNYIKILQSSPQGTLITYCEDGSKAKVIVWFYPENEKIYIISNKNSKKVKHLKKNPKACLKISYKNNFETVDIRSVKLSICFTLRFVDS